MIYLIDDKQDFLDNFKASYDGKSQLKTFSHPNEALLTVFIDRPKVLITDVFMPLTNRDGVPSQGMDGLKLAKLVKSLMPEVEIVIISGNDRDHINQKHPDMLERFDYFFEKPLPDEFDNTIKNLEKKDSYLGVSLKLTQGEVERLSKHEGETLQDKIYRIIRSA